MAEYARATGANPQATGVDNPGPEEFSRECPGRGPARKPLGFTILNNRTLVALTLQWHPGFDGGHPPQTFTLQYKASTEDQTEVKL
ncbi:hypothetical protein NP493_2622g00009 [Ridgeia piscesae]|uniref:Uncharacterized protein n=1 Tax=Ridgeia piscesae TaxID=27915 RepID=A0AAD9JEX1_RIDPI|nr:hypothetical protein NP493_2622g00009 [Ridgeia piscesae]